MREFILYSRTGWTGPKFKTLHDAGRLDIVHRSILNAIYTSHALRKDVIFHAILGGPPFPPVEMIVDGSGLSNASPDESSWEQLIRRALSGKPHPGVSIRKNSLQALVMEKKNLFVLDESGQSIRTAELGTDPAFVLGDQLGLPKKDEEFVMRYAKKVSIGRNVYLASQCIGIVNYILDLRETA
jgi:tRNA (pseudouridine54-N1)-methyltransferase